tara:strand:- start:7271 stop:8092 length:822 start_codon:yes stop_codon:yes gene_type:complete
MNTFPSGLSFTQAKKDAKKLAKRDNIPLFEAQDIIAQEHSRSLWSEAVRQKEQRIKLTFNGDEVIFPKEKTITSVLGEAGTGKSVFMLDVAAQILQQGRGVLYISSFVGRSSVYLNEQYHDLLQKKYPSMFHHALIERLQNADSIMLGGKVLLIDEPWLLANKNVREKLLSLIRASKDTFIATQSPLDLAFLEPLQKKSPSCVSNVVLFKIAHSDIDALIKGSNGKLSGVDKRSFSDFVSSLGVVGGLESRFMFNERLLSLAKEQLPFVVLSQ